VQGHAGAAPRNYDAAMPAPSGTVHLVDDDPSVLRSLARLVHAEGLEARAWDSAAEFLAAEGVLPFPACLVLDLKMPGMDGAALQDELARRGRNFPIVFLTAHADVPASVRAVKAGAIDFLLKPFVPEQLLAVVRGALARSSETMREVTHLEALRARHADLTRRERQVFELVVRGLLNKEVAAELGAAEKTIKVHRARVMRKMGADTLAALVQQAVVLGELSPAAAPAVKEGAAGPPGG
jgi:FixJ family two-component response regulator